ncbi:acyl-CoA dehydrogenase family protein [Nonomuraea salmonea]|uniref:acyl-CoA dehydrogenase family protein n=1 Tax=Nonomuraea salmonea TaxID=46181 RepID=UPI0031ED75D5
MRRCTRSSPSGSSPPSPCSTGAGPKRRRCSASCASRPGRRACGRSAIRASWAGGGLPFLDYVYVNEVQGHSEYGQLALGTYTLQDSLMLHEHASPEQRERYLEPLVRGDISPSFAMTEPAVSSSDPTQLATTAVLDGDEWVINGHKWFTTGGVAGGVHDRDVPHRARRAAAPRLLHDPGADGHAGLHDRARDAGAGARRGALRGAVRGRPRTGRQPARAARAGLRHRPEAARPRADLPLHALARPGAAGPST